MFLLGIEGRLETTIEIVMNNIVLENVKTHISTGQ